MREPILRVMCHEPEGSIERSVRLAPLSMENLRKYWDKLSKFKTLFNRHIRDLDDFIHTWVRQEGDTLKANGIIWEVDDVGIFYMTNIYPAFQANGHFSFWDQRYKGRELLILEMLQYVFQEFGFRRIQVEVPLFVQPTLRFVQELGFVREGRLRKYAFYNNEWWDVVLFSMLEEEINGHVGAKRAIEGGPISSDAIGGGRPGHSAEADNGRDVRGGIRTVAEASGNGDSAVRERETDARSVQ